MNFLLHRHIAASELRSEAAGVGAMLPDLWRMADRRVRAAPAQDARALSESVNGGAPERPLLADVLAGIEHHVVVDRWFHATPEHQDGERACAERLRASGVSRAPLFAHVVWEMALDGALVAKEGLPRVRNLLHRGFRATAEARDEAARLHHFGRVPRTPEERALFDHRMDRLTVELERGAWIDSYRTGPGLAACLLGVRARLGLPSIHQHEASRIADALGAIASEAPRALSALLERRAAELELSGR